MQSAQSFGSLPFELAAQEWIQKETPYHAKPKTLKTYSDYIKRLSSSLARMNLKEIHIGHLREYQRTRKIDYHPRYISKSPPRGNLRCARLVCKPCLSCLTFFAAKRRVHEHYIKETRGGREQAAVNLRSRQRLRRSVKHWLHTPPSNPWRSSARHSERESFQGRGRRTEPYLA